MEWWIPKVAPGKKVGGWWRLEDRGYVGRFRPNTVEARDRSVDCLSAALFHHRPGNLCVGPGTHFFRHLSSLRTFNYLENPVHLLLLQFMGQVIVKIAVKLICPRKLA